MIRLKITDTGDFVQLEEGKAKLHGLNRGDEISLAKWHEIISSDINNAILNFAQDQSMSDAHRSIERLWMTLGAKFGINVTYQDLLHAILKPEASDDFVVLLADHFLLSTTKLISNLDQVIPEKRYASQVNQVRAEFLAHVRLMDRDTKRLFNQKINQCKAS